MPADDRVRPAAIRCLARQAARALAGFCVAGALAVPPAESHALLHRVLETDSGVRVEWHFADGDKPFFETYRVFGPGDDRPFQTGRVNAIGEVSFWPDRPGMWRVMVTTEDGHGAEVGVRVDVDGLDGETQGSGTLPRWERLTAGAGYVLGVFGIIALWRVNRARRGRA